MDELNRELKIYSHWEWLPTACFKSSRGLTSADHVRLAQLPIEPLRGLGNSNPAAKQTNNSLWYVNPKKNTEMKW